jgi:HD-like signal output (HDOD) protein
MTLRVLFVDDEPNVLRSLARMIRIQRLPWEPGFAPSGEAALTELEGDKFDAVVTDLTMPEMDGITLLARVRARWPQISRVVLSGQCTIAQSLRAADVAHQFLAKPCDGALLRRTVERLAWIRTLGVTPLVQRTAAGLSCLPSPAGIHAAIQSAAAAAASLDDMGRLVEEDIALTAKLVQLVSTSFFTQAAPVASARGALEVLGSHVAHLVLASREIARPADGAGGPARIELAPLCARATITGRIAREIAPGELADRAFTAALLHDVGRLVVACAAAGGGAADIEPAPRATDHAAVGGYLLGLWGLPDDIVSAVTYQAAPDTAPVEHRALATLVHAARTRGQESHARDCEPELARRTD